MWRPCVPPALTAAAEENYLKYITLKLARYSVAPLLLFGLPRLLPPHLYSDKVLFVPHVISSVLATGFALQSASDLVTEMRAPGDPILFLVFRTPSPAHTMCV